MSRLSLPGKVGSRNGREPHFGLSRQSGWSLMGVLVWLLILSSLALFLSVRVSSQAVATGDVERQLFSLVLAANGIEYARAILPGLDLNQQLLGADGIRQEGEATSPRNPMSFAEARRLNSREWSPESDDGFPWGPEGQFLPQGYATENDGLFFLRFSNNPEEQGHMDEDGIILARSMGVARSRFVHPFFPSVKNSVSLVEASFRQEKLFNLPSPLTLFGSGGEFRWEGEHFSLDGGDRVAVSVVTPEGGTLLTDLTDSLTPPQQVLLQGGGATPSIQDATASFREDSALQVVFEGSFWAHFLSRIAGFAGRLDGIQYFPAGAFLDGIYSGVILANGDVTLLNARIEGLFIHLGGGEVRLEGRTSIRGGAWISSVENPETGEVAPISLTVADLVTVSFDHGIVQSAASRFPVTQLGWRIIFPEMAQ